MPKPTFLLSIPLWVLLNLALLNTASFAATGIDQIKICMDFSCKNPQTISLSQSEWDSVANWFAQASPNAAAERGHIKNAIGWMEVIVGKHTPTHRDVGGDLPDEAEFPGQLDCIDESLNTTAYLKLFEENDLLKHHKVIDRAYRRAIFDQHWAGQIETLEGAEQWVVDSWFQHNGYLPYIQTTQEWEKIPFFTSYLDSSQDKDKKPGSLLRRLFN
ncbi:MAG: hypothetical protein V3V09_05225 [Arenicellales bacterium]